MGYKGASLVDLVTGLEQITKDTGQDLAESMQKHGQQNIAKNTPVETHHLRESYKRTPVTYGPGGVMQGGLFAARVFSWSGEVYTEVEYAPYVDRGTGLFGPYHRKYLIKPKQPGGVLAFHPYQRTPAGGVVFDVHGAPTTTGKPVFVRFVMHPGAPGHEMFKIGAALTEAEYEEWSQEPLRLWREKIEGRHF